MCRHGWSWCIGVPLSLRHQDHSNLELPGSRLLKPSHRIQRRVKWMLSRLFRRTRVQIIFSAPAQAWSEAVANHKEDDDLQAFYLFSVSLLRLAGVKARRPTIRQVGNQLEFETQLLLWHTTTALEFLERAAAAWGLQFDDAAAGLFLRPRRSWARQHQSHFALEEEPRERPPAPFTGVIRVHEEESASRPLCRDKNWKRVS